MAQCIQPVAANDQHLTGRSAGDRGAPLLRRREEANLPDHLAGPHDAQPAVAVVDLEDALEHNEQLPLHEALLRQ